MDKESVVPNEANDAEFNMTISQLGLHSFREWKTTLEAQTTHTRTEIVLFRLCVLKENIFTPCYFHFKNYQLSK